MKKQQPPPPRFVSQPSSSKSGPIYLLACVGLIVWSLIAGRQEFEFARHAKHITATVIGHRTTHNSNHVSLIEFEYKGKTYGHYLTADGRLEEGAEVSVLLNPSDPDRSVVNDNLQIFANALALAGMAVFFGILTLFKIRDFLPSRRATLRHF